MIHCKNKCPLGKFDGCCRSCPDRPDCPEACEHDPAQCGDATWDEETALAVFRKSQLATLNAITSLTAHKKAIEEQEKNMKAALFAAMEQYGIKKFETDALTLTYVAPHRFPRPGFRKAEEEIPRCGGGLRQRHPQGRLCQDHPEGRGRREWSLKPCPMRNMKSLFQT